MIIDLQKSKEVLSEFDKYKNDGIKLCKDLQNDKVSLSEKLEQLDPSPRNEEGELVSPVDAFERHLMALDVKLSGNQQWTMEKLYNKVEYLMPELILRTVKEGMKVAEHFNYLDCIAAQVPSATASYHPLYIPELNRSSASSRRNKSLGKRASVGKGGEFPVSQIVLRQKNITVNDSGRQIQAAYKVIKDYGFSDFAVFLKLIGAQMAADKLLDVYNMGISGDGTVGGASDTFAGAAGTLAYNDLITNQTSYDAPYVMDRILAPQQSIEATLTLAQFQDPLSGWEFQKSGKLVTPMGAKLKHVSATPGSTPTGTEIVTLDSRFAVKEVLNQALSVESDKIINRKLERAVVSECSEFCIVSDGALKRIIWT